MKLYDRVQLCGIQTLTIQTLFTFPTPNVDPKRFLFCVICACLAQVAGGLHRVGFAAHVVVRLQQSAACRTGGLAELLGIIFRDLWGPGENDVP